MDSVVAGCDKNERSGYWTGAGTISGGSGGVLTVEAFNPPPALKNCVPVYERALPDILGWTDGIGDRRFGGEDPLSTGDSRSSSTGTLDCLIGGGRRGRGPGLVATVDLRIPCPGFVGRSTSEEGSVSDGAGCNCFVGGVIRSNASGGGEAPGGCLSICSAIRTAARVRVVVLMEILYSVCAIWLPRRSWLAVPSPRSDASGGIPLLTILPGVVPPSTRLRSPPRQLSLVSDVAYGSPSALPP